MDISKSLLGRDALNSDNLKLAVFFVTSILRNKAKSFVIVIPANWV
jgi:hypothetical protein